MGTFTFRLNAFFIYEIGHKPIKIRSEKLQLWCLGLIVSKGSLWLLTLSTWHELESLGRHLGTSVMEFLDGIVELGRFVLSTSGIIMWAGVLHWCKRENEFSTGIHLSASWLRMKNDQLSQVPETTPFWPRCEISHRPVHKPDSGIFFKFHFSPFRWSQSLTNWQKTNQCVISHRSISVLKSLLASLS